VAERRVSGGLDDRVPEDLLPNPERVHVVLERETGAGPPHRRGADEGHLLERDRSLLEERGQLRPVVRGDLLGYVGDEVLVLRAVARDLVEDRRCRDPGEAIEIVEQRRQDARALGADRVGVGRWMGGAGGDRRILTTVLGGVKSTACPNALDSTSCDGSTMRQREDWVAPTMREEAGGRKLANRRESATH
jgi:hypothetical protein